MPGTIGFANIILIFHALVLGIIVSGTIALFTGRFSNFNKRDYFAFLFLACCLGEILSQVFLGECILTRLERDSRLRADPTSIYADTFINEYLPFVPVRLVKSSTVLIAGVVFGTIVQIWMSVKRRAKDRRRAKNTDHGKQRQT